MRKTTVATSLNILTFDDVKYFLMILSKESKTERKPTRSTSPKICTQFSFSTFQLEVNPIKGFLQKTFENYIEINVKAVVLDLF